MILGVLLFLLFGVTHLTYGIDVYYEFISVFFFTFNLYNVVFYLLNEYCKSFNNINPEHKKMYVVKNYIKSFYLACLCFTLPYYISGDYDILFIKRCAIYYFINDIIGLILVKKLPMTTKIHHCTSTIGGLIILNKSANTLDIITLIVLYAIFSSLTFLVNFYLGYRVYSDNIIIKYYLSLIANIIYVFSCIINWLLQIYLFFSIIWNIPLHHTILYICFLYSVVKDDLVLMHWLYNDQCKYKKCINF
jgi:hypothetical protein